MSEYMAIDGVIPNSLVIPKANVHALRLVNKYNIDEVFRAERMYRNGKPEVNIDNVYCITSFELGSH